MGPTPSGDAGAHGVPQENRTQGVRNAAFRAIRWTLELAEKSVSKRESEGGVIVTDHEPPTKPR